MQRKDYFIITHHQPEIKTVGDFLFQDGLNVLKGQAGGSAKLITGVTATDFLNLKDAEGISNRQRIKARYTPAVLNQGHDGAEMPLVYGTDLIVPYANVTREFLLTSGDMVKDVQQYRNMDYFLAEQLKALLRDKSLTRAYQMKEKTTVGNVRELYPMLSVWCWSRALSPADSGDGRVVNLTPFVKNLTTNVTATGGNFNLELTPIQGTFGPNEDNDEGVSFDFGGRKLNGPNGSLGYLTDSNLGGETRTPTFLHNLIQQNDILFIRFEQADGEKRTASVNNNFIIPKGELPGQLYDMIALVDTNTLNTNAEGSQTLAIKGRDMMKLLIEDGSYFYPLEFANGMFYHTGNHDNGDSLTLRSMADGKLMTAALYIKRSVDFSLRFILQNLSNLSVAPDSLFDGWGTRRTTRFAIPEDSKYNEKRRQWATEQNNFRAAALENIEEARKDSNLHRGEPDEEAKQCRATFNQLVAFVKFMDENNILNLIVADDIGSWVAGTYQGQKFGPNKLPESFSKTFFKGDPTVASSSAVNNAYGYMDRRRKLESFEGAEYHERPAKGLWSIVKLEVDESVSKRRIVDASIAGEQGSILNTIKKLCHEPFIQFTGDTYGDQYYFTVRQAPFTKAAMFKAAHHEDTPTIDNADVLNDSLQFATESYSWYRLTPKASLMGDGEAMSLSFLPAIYFPEFANVYGSKPLDITTNYIPYSGLVDSSNQVNMNYVEKQAFFDLKYLIDSHSYLPFTRQGTITILPNRGIKRGMFVKYAPTGECFYVDDVTQNYALNDGNISRTTTLTVSRGMVVQHMSGKHSYFKIVQTPLTDDQFTGNGGNNGVFDNWRVNKDQFAFFQRRGQFNQPTPAPLPTTTTDSTPAKPKQSGQRPVPKYRG